MLRLGVALFAVALVLPGKAGGADPLEKARAIVAAMKPGTWRELPNTRMQEVFPKREGHPAWGVMGPRAVTVAWGGAAFDTKRNIFVVTGGGHTDYGGNEVYEFSLETMQWTRTTEPSPLRQSAGPVGTFEVADGTEAPVSSHTYDGLLYLPNVDRVFKFGGSYYRVGWPYDPHAYLYSTETKTWQRRSAAPTGSLEVSSAYDPRTGEALVGTAKGVWAYDPVHDRWRSVADQSSRGMGYVADFHPLSRQFVQVGNSKVPIFYCAVDGLRKCYSVLKLSGHFVIPNASGIAFDPISRNFALWGGSREVWTLDTQTWTVRLFPNSDGAAPDHQIENANGNKTRGIYGRWQYVPALRVFIGYGDAADNVWLYKLRSKAH